MQPSKASLVLVSLLALGLSACAASSPSAEPSSRSETAEVARSGSEKHQALLPSPSGPLDMSAAAGTNLSLDELLARVSKLTGVTFSVDPQVNERLEHTMVALSQDKRVPAADVYPWFEAILQQNGYSLGVLKSGESPLVGVYTPIGGGQSRAPMVSVEPEQLDECRMHPALLVTTVVHLPHTDVRTLGNSLRGLTSDPTGAQGILPVGNTNSVILAGTGRNVADLVAMLRTIDAQSERDIAPAQANAPAKP